MQGRSELWIPHVCRQYCKIAPLALFSFELLLTNFVSVTFESARSSLFAFTERPASRAASLDALVPLFPKDKKQTWRTAS